MNRVNLCVCLYVCVLCACLNVLMLILLSMLFISLLRCTHANVGNSRTTWAPRPPRIKRIGCKFAHWGSGHSCITALTSPPSPHSPHCAHLTSLTTLPSLRSPHTPLTALTSPPSPHTPLLSQGEPGIPGVAVGPRGKRGPKVRTLGCSPTILPFCLARINHPFQLPVVL